jgi:hypothetical protein
MYTLKGRYGMPGDKKEFSGSIEQITQDYYKGILLENEREKEIYVYEKVLQNTRGLIMLIPFNKRVHVMNKEDKSGLAGEYSGSIEFYTEQIPILKNYDEACIKTKKCTPINYYDTILEIIKK